MTNAEELRKDRASLRISQIQLAKLAGVSRNKIQLFEEGFGALEPSEDERIRNVVATVRQEMIRTLTESRPIAKFSIAADKKGGHDGAR